MTASLKKIDFFSWEGTISRSDFWRAYLILMIPAFLSSMLAPLLAPFFYQWMAWSLVSFLGFLLMFQVIKRLHDTDRSGWMTLILFIPFINVYVLYLLFIKK